MRTLTTFFLILMVVISTACRTRAVQNNNTSATAVVEDTKAQRISELGIKFEAIKSGKRLVSTAAMLGDTIDGPCTLYHEFDSLRTAYHEYDKLGGHPTLSATMKDDVKKMAQKVTTTAYDRMKSGKLLGCVKLTNETLTLFSNIAKLMDEYGRPADTESFDPTILRAACLREIKPEVQEILAIIKKHDSSDTLGLLSNYISEVKTTWQFTPEEIGVPKSMINRLNL